MHMLISLSIACHGESHSVTDNVKLVSAPALHVRICAFMLQ
jgi:hypothetical protein